MNKSFHVVVFLTLIFLVNTASATLTTATLTAPAQNATISGTYRLIASVGGGESADNATFYWRDSPSSSWSQICQNITAGNSFNCDWDSSGIPDGTGYIFNVTAENNTVTVSDSNNNVTVDNNQPVVQLSSPGDNSWTSNTTIQFSFLARDNASQTMNCTLYIDDNANQSNSSVLNNTATTFSVSNLADGTHNWSVRCSDSIPNTGSSSTRNLNVNTGTPTVTLTSPGAGATSYTGNVDFVFTVTDSTSTKLNCTLYLNNVASASNNAVPNGTSTTFTINGISEGSHLWRVECTNNASTTDSSANRSLIVDFCGNDICGSGEGCRNCPEDCDECERRRRGTTIGLWIPIPSELPEEPEEVKKLFINLAKEVFQEGEDLKVVVRDEDGNPVSDAVVTIGEKSGTTDSNGEALFQEIGQGDYVIQVSKQGYEGTSLSVSVGPKPTTEEEPIKEEALLLKRQEKPSDTTGLLILVVAIIVIVALMTLLSKKVKT